MLQHRFSRVAVAAVVALFIPAGAAAQEPAGSVSLTAPEEWLDLPHGQTAPLRTPPVRPLQVGPEDGYKGVVRASDGSQVAWAQHSDGSQIAYAFRSYEHVPTEIVVADIWGGGRRVVHRVPLGGFVDPVGVAFTRDSTAVLFVSGDTLRRVDLVSGQVSTLAVDDRLTVEEGSLRGATVTVGLRHLPTGDVVVDRMCQTESCTSDRPLLWRSDTGHVQELPYNAEITHDGRQLVAVHNVDGDPQLRTAPVRQPSEWRAIVTLDAFASVSIRHDDEVVALTGMDSGPIEVRSLEDGELLGSAPAPEGARFSGGDWSPDGSQVLINAVWRTRESFSREPWVFDLESSTAASVADRDLDLLAAGWTTDGSPLVKNNGMWRVDDDGELAKVIRSSPHDETRRPRRPVVGAVDRYAGEDRVATATALSRAAFEAAATVVVARADLYPDALSGAALAGQVDGPVLLTGSDRLDGRVAAEVDRLGASTAYVLGTADVVSRQVERDLRAAGVEQVTRLGGADRFETAAMVADEVGAGRRQVFLVEGQHVNPARGWPDAVAVAGEAAATATPVLLATTERVPAATREAIADLGVERVTIVGGPVAISREVEEQVRSWGVAVDRVAGDTRYATSVAVASRQAEASVPFAVTGSNWPDALAAGPAAAHVGGTVLLVPPDSITTNRHVEAFLHDRAGTIDRVAVAGSTGVVSQRIVRELDRILRNG